MLRRRHVKKKKTLQVVSTHGDSQKQRPGELDWRSQAPVLQSVDEDYVYSGVCVLFSPVTLLTFSKCPCQPCRGGTGHFGTWMCSKLQETLRVPCALGVGGLGGF